MSQMETQETAVDHEALIAAAHQAQLRAYAPYSHYAVGAALLTRSGEVITGSNVENAVYPATICAERVAITRAVSEGHREFEAIAIVTDNGGTPCGICRQVMHEFAPHMEVLIVSDEGLVATYTVADLLPEGFSSQQLPASARAQQNNNT